MLREKNECIYVKGFGALILDYEFPTNEEWGLPAYVSCRVLIEDLYQTTIHAETREKAIEIFKSGEWRNIA